MTERHEQQAEDLANDLERDAEDMQRQGDSVGEEVHNVSEDWRRKRGDQAVPGAQPPQPEERTEQERSGEDEDPAHESPAGGEGAPA